MQVVPLSGDEIGLLAAASDGQGTVKQNQWAQNRYRVWAHSHNLAVPSDNIPRNSLILYSIPNPVFLCNYVY